MSSIVMCWQVKRKDSERWQTLQCAQSSDDYGDDAEHTFERGVGQFGSEFLPDVFSGRNGMPSPVPEDQRLKWPPDFDPYSDGNLDFDVRVCDDCGGCNDDCDEDCDIDHSEDCEDHHERPLLDMGSPLGWLTLDDLKTFKWYLNVGKVEVFMFYGHTPVPPFGEFPPTGSWYRRNRHKYPAADDPLEAKQLAKEHGVVMLRLSGGMVMSDVTEGLYPRVIEEFEKMIDTETHELRIIVGEVG